MRRTLAKRGGRRSCRNGRKTRRFRGGRVSSSRRSGQVGGEHCEHPCKSWLLERTDWRSLEHMKSLIDIRLVSLGHVPAHISSRRWDTSFCH